MFSALDPGPSSPGLRIGWGHCIVFFGKTLDCYVASLDTGVYDRVAASCQGNLAKC